MVKTVMLIASVLAIVYLVICALVYCFQEKVIFFPERLDVTHAFNFPEPYDEMFIHVRDGVKLNGLLFRADNSKGLIFYLHGNAGSLDGWAGVASAYLPLGYDVFLMDYRGYGKSEGTIMSEEDLVNDVQDVYQYMLQHYHEESVIVLGYSLGSGLAANIASQNSPRMLIMQAPYYSLTDMMRTLTPFLPTFLLKYKLRTNEALPKCRMPIVMFHGDQDEVIPVSQSLKLKPLLKPGDTLITLPGAGHNGMTESPQYVAEMARLLGRKNP